MFAGAKKEDWHLKKFSFVLMNKITLMNKNRANE